ncbi:MAG: DUF2807 domain-containing protein, partial [Muribaculaceae bacterium]|nr:DUF2807 domain-containing protein [Muribaculaceae bacterium]
QLLSVVLLALAILPSCANPQCRSFNKVAHETIIPSKMVEHTFNVSSSFTSIVAEGCIDVVFTQSGKEFEVKGLIPENFIDKMNVQVNSNTLYISMKPGQYNLSCENGKIPTIYISNKTLRNVSTKGSGDFIVNGNLHLSKGDFNYKSSGSGVFKCGKLQTPDKITFSLSGSGDIQLDSTLSRLFEVNISGSGNANCGSIQASTCGIEIKGSGNVKISGTADSVELTIAGSGDIDAEKLKATTGNALVAGSGYIRCNVKQLTEHTKGTGKILNRF